MVTPRKMRQTWTRPGKQRMLVGCSDRDTFAGSHTGGVWVIGDSTIGNDNLTVLDRPKVFESVNGPVDCDTGILAVGAAFGVESLCWGTVLGTVRGRREPLVGPRVPV